ncbi:DEAD/DEAH box helicase family protein [Chloroflexota bacterium]
MPEPFLYEQLNSVSEMGFLKKDIPDCIKNNLKPTFELRPYQIEAFSRFFHCLDNDFPGKGWPLHLLFNMATGSGKTLIMAGLILYLYERGYRNFLFFVNSTNIIEKTKGNFLNPLSSKHLFNDQIYFGTKRVSVSSVGNFEGVNPGEINICFTTIQKLHSDLTTEKENSLTYEDFKNKKIVLIADEAHHMNVKTKAQLELFESWENTVERIFHQNQDTLLLEFTATLDYFRQNIVDKYRKKVIYRYDLQQYRNDRYSKDVYIVQSDFDENDRILQALIVSQYKYEVAAKNRINLKPVILFKAQRTIEQSKQNKANFHNIIENLAPDDIERIRNISKIPLVQHAFDFFNQYGINSQQLALRLKSEFNESRCLSVNEEIEKETQQIRLNSLEDKDNPIRAIFAVQKLNEGWDVLNLFDIVRCYEGRDSKAGKPGKTTIAEAQLIGRGARYFPFAIAENNDRYKRKFDNDLNHELRALEELHYHSVNDSRYISELRTALIEEGILDDREKEYVLKLKDPFKQTDFYNKGLIFKNDRYKNTYDYVKSFSDFGIKKRNIAYSIASGKGTTGALLSDEKAPKEIKELTQKDVKVSAIPKHITQNAVAMNPFFRFNVIKKYFPDIASINDFIQSGDYLGGLEITYKADAETLSHIPNQHHLEALLTLLEQVESEIRKNITEFKGTKEFKPSGISQVFYDKVLKLDSQSERAQGDETFVSDKEWYVFNANYGTSEEKAFVRMLDRQIDKLGNIYENIYLIRNERHFKIFDTKGQAFEPDFVLFLQEKEGKLLTYQLFIEPKGKYLKEHDQWKQDLLKDITNQFAGKIIDFGENQKYRLIGVPFYNNQDENIFKQSLYEALHVNPT